MKTYAIDTNILVRLLVLVDEEQTRIVEDLLMQSRLVILWSVLLETEWVLRSIVKADRASITEKFRSLLFMPSLQVERAEEMAKVLDLHEAGMDFADAMHLVLAGARTFITFDRALVRRAKRKWPEARVELAQDAGEDSQGS
ncbi:hypothetical protein BJF92_10720 [Rhizobium rhizosphaerae]|uniref:PIN domain-containing protein n=1 Tax=Xaviernesmea rhizosphaerae TaxID=1672749 RepID=A0A1Q9AMJ2_9HYPH|nr:type II toxin-antitoxin system VapC family toxin [Xaviernesmea rhizosphaerae]OLP56566.1 hypothetical protein BJF92_10720 [Xaviernesmea rhizosphaerae]